jgi:hypothetical protein
MKMPLISFSFLVLILSLFAPHAYADDVLGPDLSTFAVLGGTPVVSFAAGNDTITGNVGVYPAASITGTFTLTGTQHAGDAPALAAQAGLTKSINPNYWGTNHPPNAGGQRSFSFQWSTEMERHSGEWRSQGDYKFLLQP